MEFLCREQRESRPGGTQIEPRLRAEDRQRASAGPIRFRLATVENESKKIVIVPHAKSYRGRGVRKTKKRAPFYCSASRADYLIFAGDTPASTVEIVRRSE